MLSEDAYGVLVLAACDSFIIVPRLVTYTGRPFPSGGPNPTASAAGIKSSRSHALLSFRKEVASPPGGVGQSNGDSVLPPSHENFVTWPALVVALVGLKGQLHP